MQQPWSYNLGMSFQCGNEACNASGCDGDNYDDGCGSAAMQPYSVNPELMFPQQLYSSDCQQQDLMEQFQQQQQQQEQPLVNLLAPNDFLMMQLFQPQPEQPEQPDDNEIFGGGGGMCSALGCCGMAQSGETDGMQAGGWPLQISMASSDMQFGLQPICSNGECEGGGSEMCCGFQSDSNGDSGGGGGGSEMCCGFGSDSSVGGLSMANFSGWNPWQRAVGMLPDI
ncbi:hypothetical protein BOX15_Mlig026847g1 [Macrostomum lignano]|uniref:Uncharacterized protein n=1 Tax=Macrostomum lignano TaxID=282301 RepID=A0A267GSJ6_9PLAT|nr:hypothetical protein BOX15_Mlig026847g1 [Macrostomum lignano]